MKQHEIFTRCGAAAWGTCSFADLHLSQNSREQCLNLCPGADGVFVAAFPYYRGDIAGNLSLYARGEDYHRVLLRRLGQAAEQLHNLYPNYHFVPGTDSSPLDERQCARLAGVGIRGKNGLVIVEPYGSYVFLGTILTDLPLPSSPAPAPECIGCGACIRACPGGALREKSFNENRCISALTQKKGVLTLEEVQLLNSHPLIWGCDICQRVCPYNQNILPSPLEDLNGSGEVPYLSSLCAEDLEGLTNRTFREKYGNRAFAWRGPAVLRRNLSLKQSDESSDSF